jgi:hypothetical protein
VAVFIAPMSPTMFTQSPHGLACDGLQIAKDDLHAIEIMEKREQVIHELFHNAARIHKAMHSNRLLIPIFRKYREACREILQQKKEEAEQFVMLSEHCDECAHDQHELKHDLKHIQSEMREIHNRTKSLEEMKWTDDDSDSSCSSCSSSSDSDDEEHEEHEESDESRDANGNDTSSSSDSDSETDSETDLSDVIEFLRQSQVDE